MTGVVRSGFLGGYEKSLEDGIFSNALLCCIVVDFMSVAADHGRLIVCILSADYKILFKSVVAEFNLVRSSLKLCLINI